MKLWLPVLTIVILQLALAIISLGFDMEPFGWTPPDAVCSSDADCARWEREHLPPSQWCYESVETAGGYCIDDPKGAK